MNNGIKGTVRILQSTERCLQSAEAALGQLRHAIQNPGAKAREVLLNTHLLLSTPSEVAPSLARTTEIVVERTAELTEPLIASASEVKPALQAADALIPAATETTPVVQATSSSSTQVAGAIAMAKEMKNDYSIKELNGQDKTTTHIQKVQTLDDILKSCEPGRETKGRAKQFNKKGTYDDAMKDFESMQPTNVRDIKNGRAGTLPDGRSVNVRKISSEGLEGSAPTLEVQEINSKKATKIRYRS